MITVEKIKDASGVLKPVIHNTPLLYSYALSGMTDGDIYLKLESLQRTGSFKIRGAYNKLYRIKDRVNKVVAASAGNHAQGVALAAKLLGLRAKVVMPEGTPINKILSVKRYGAKVVLHGTNFDESYSHAKKLEKKDRSLLINAFDDNDVICGQGTIGLEVAQALPDVDTVLVPVGGGGLISGVAVALKELNPSVEIIGVEAKNVPSMSKSLEKGVITEPVSKKTIADGIAVKKVGHLTFKIARNYVDDIITVSEKQIEESLMILASKKRLIVEGAGAVGLSGLMKRKKSFKNKKTAIIISGGNIDINVLTKIIDRGLQKEGRIMKLEIELPDVPGALAGLSEIFARLRANIMQINHDRLSADLPLGGAYVQITLETTSFDHQNEILDILQKKGYKVS